MYGTNLFGIGMPELVFVAILALIVLGPQRLPGAIREVGKFIRQARSLTSELTSQFSEELALLEEINPQKIIQELIDDPKEKEKKDTKGSNKKSTSKAATKASPKDAITNTKKVSKPAAGSKPALGATDTAESEPSTKDDVEVTEQDDTAENETSAEEAADKSMAVESDTAGRQNTDRSNDVIEEAEAVAAKVELSEIENRIAPPSMDGAAQALRGKNVTKAATKTVEKTVDEVADTQDKASGQSPENASDENIVDAKAGNTAANADKTDISAEEANGTL